MLLRPTKPGSRNLGFQVLTLFHEPDLFHKPTLYDKLLLFDELALIKEPKLLLPNDAS